MFSKKVLIALSLPFMFSLTACGGDGGDGGGGDANQNVVRNIFAVGDILEAREDTSGVTGNVCENDLPDTCDLPDDSDKKLSFALKSGEAMENGSFSFCADGTYKYTPSKLFTGFESIDYTYSGEGSYGIGTLEINIMEAGAVQVGSVSNTNLHGDAATYALAAGEATENGTLVFCHNGDVEYTPVQDFFGVDSIEYVASLNGDTSIATLTINVANDFETLDEYGWSLEWSHDFTDPAGSNLDLWSGNYSLTDDGLTINPNDGQEFSLKGGNQISVERGRIEAKLKTAAGIDVISAFKLVPVSDSFDGDNSLSLMLAEDEAMTAGAYYGLEKVSGVIMNDAVQSTASEEWHTYAIEWGEKQIRWYVDGTHIYTVNTLNVWSYNQSGDNPRGDEIIANTTTFFDQRTPDPLGERKDGPFDQAMQIIFDLQAQPGNITSEMQVEYVKVWSCDPTVEPNVDECASNEKLKISRAASDRIETVGFEKTIFFEDGNIDPATKDLISEFNPLSWHYWKDKFELTITQYGNPVITYPTLNDDNGLVIDFNNRSGTANLNIGTESAELNGYDFSLNFDLYINSAKTDVETIKIKMQSGNSGDDSADDLATIEVAISLDELELDTWNSLSFNIPEDLNTPSESSLDFDPNNITSFMILEVDNKVHLQLDNIFLSCVNSEGCLQGPMSMQTPPAPVAEAIRIEAEDEDEIVSKSGIGFYDVTAPDEGGGKYVGDVNNLDFVSYSFNAPAIGPYTINYRVASFGGSAGFDVELDGTPLHSISIDDTGGWEEWVTLTSPEFELLSGIKTIEIKFVGDNQNLNWLEIQPPVGEFKIWADEFDVIGSPTIKLENEEDTEDGRTGQNIGYVESADDYVEYTVFIPSTGSYLIEYRVAGEYDSQGFDVLLDDILIDTQALENPRGWQNWATQSSTVESLTKGEKTMRLNFYGDPINTNWIKFTRLAPE